MSTLYRCTDLVDLWKHYNLYNLCQNSEVLIASRGS